MKALILLLLIGTILPCVSYGQRGLVGTGSPGALPPTTNHGLAPSFFNRWPTRDQDFGPRQNAAGVWGSPFGWWTNTSYGGSSSGNCSMSGDEQGPPAAEFAPPVPEPFPPPPPDRPARMVIHEYSWPAATPPYAQAFTIVLKDGQVMRAAAIWRTDNALNFTGAGGGGGRLMLNSIDIEATRKLNAQAGLVWPSTLR